MLGRKEKCGAVDCGWVLAPKTLWPLLTTHPQSYRGGKSIKKYEGGEKRGMRGAQAQGREEEYRRLQKRGPNTRSEKGTRKRRFKGGLIQKEQQANREKRPKKQKEILFIWTREKNRTTRTERTRM